MKICACGQKSVTGLRKGVALCQYHFNAKCYGKNWAKKVQMMLKAKINA
jgi:hypothetical protein